MADETHDIVDVLGQIKNSYGQSEQDSYERG